MTDTPQDDQQDPVAAFARGDISRHDAMDALGIGYGELIDRVAQRGLSLPSLPDEEIDRMAEDVVRLLELAHPRSARR